MLGQFVRTNFISETSSKYKVETPWEDCDDDEKDSDNESDQNLCAHQFSFKIIVKENHVHNTSYFITHSEKITEVVSPPPKS